MESRGGMHDRIDGDTLSLSGLSPGPGNGLSRKELGQGKASQGYYHLGIHLLDLTIQVFATGGNLGGKGLSIVGGTTLHHVGYEHVLAPEAG